MKFLCEFGADCTVTYFQCSFELQQYILEPFFECSGKKHIQEVALNKLTLSKISAQYTHSMATFPTASELSGKLMKFKKSQPKSVVILVEEQFQIKQGINQFTPGRC